jgi:dihydrolipoamide dehydrogenase
MIEYFISEGIFMSNRKVDTVIIGAGTAGLYALSEVKKSGRSWLLIQGGEDGTTCARVGCMPSKVLLKTAELFNSKDQFANQGILGSSHIELDPAAVMTHLRKMRDMFTDGVRSRTTERMDDNQLIRGYAEFTGKNSLVVNGQVIEFENAIVATGSSPVIPTPWQNLENVYTTDSFFEIEQLPSSTAIIGMGAIGLEMGQALSQLGVRVAGFDQAETIAGIQDASLLEDAIKTFSSNFPIYLGEPVTLKQGDSGGVTVIQNGIEKSFDTVLIAMGRRSNILNMNLEAAGATIIDGQVAFDEQTMSVEGTSLFIAGDSTSERAVMHEAADEGLIAGYNTNKATPRKFKRKTALGIVFTQPNIARIGDLTEDDSTLSSIAKLTTNGRAKVKHAKEGGIKLIADRETGAIRGAEIVSVDGEHLAHLLAWAIEQNQTVMQLSKMPTYHPVVEEALTSSIDSLAHQLNPNNSSAENKLTFVD